MGETLINVHAVLSSSSVNGPGERLVVFFQGCARNCPGCFNPDTHPFAERTLLGPSEIFSKYHTRPVEGLTVSGGEPFAQPEGLASLLKLARSRSLSTVVYTGRSYDDIESSEPERACLEFIDVLIDGPFERDRKEPGMLARGSANQRFHFLTDRYTASDMVMPGRIEVIITEHGVVMETGFGEVPLTSEMI